MTDARKDILERIRAGLGRGPLTEGAISGLEKNLAAPTRHLIPERGRGEGRALVDRFRAEAERANATIARIAAREDAPAGVAAYLKEHGLPTAIRAAPALENVSWTEQNGLTAGFGPAGADDAIGVTEAFAGVAETGTLVTLSGPQTPSSLNFLPDTHIVLLDSARIFAAYEDVWTRLRTELGSGEMLRAVTWIAGPSRSADIELKLLLGVHGPRRLHILLIDGQGG